MCFTLNSATEWTGSRFKVVVTVCGAASVLMLDAFLSLGLYYVITIVVRSYIVLVGIFLRSVPEIGEPGSNQSVNHGDG